MSVRAPGEKGEECVLAAIATEAAKTAKARETSESLFILCYESGELNAVKDTQK